MREVGEWGSMFHDMEIRTYQRCACRELAVKVRVFLMCEDSRNDKLRFGIVVRPVRSG